MTAPPTPSFTVSEKSGCVPFTPRFTSTTTPPGAEFFFVISNEDGTVQDTISDQTFTYTFTTPGYYSVDYYTSTADAEACQKSLLNPNFIFAADFPDADFTWSPDEPTNGRPVQFLPTSQPEKISHSFIGILVMEELPLMRIPFTHTMFCQMSLLMCISELPIVMAVVMTP